VGPRISAAPEIIPTSDFGKKGIDFNEKRSSWKLWHYWTANMGTTCRKSRGTASRRQIC